MTLNELEGNFVYRKLKVQSQTATKREEKHRILNRAVLNIPATTTAKQFNSDNLYVVYETPHAPRNQFNS